MTHWRPVIFAITLLFISIAFLSTPLFALSGMVIRVEGEKIVLNKGSMDSMTPDQELFVHRIGKPVATIKVSLVDSYSSEARVVKLEPEETIKVGDVVSTEPFSIPYTPPPLAERDDWQTGWRDKNRQQELTGCFQSLYETSQ
jgi:hypothetical protein